MRSSALQKPPSRTRPTLGLVQTDCHTDSVSKTCLSAPHQYPHQYSSPPYGCTVPACVVQNRTIGLLYKCASLRHRSCHYSRLSDSRRTEKFSGSHLTVTRDSSNFAKWPGLRLPSKRDSPPFVSWLLSCMRPSARLHRLSLEVQWPELEAPFEV